MAASGSAVGLGNIWGFPTQAAANGGAAFVLVYLILAFLLAYPVLMAELILGRHAHGNAVDALITVSRTRVARSLAWISGSAGVIVAALILSFYSIVAGWMAGLAFAYSLDLAGATAGSEWLRTFSLERNLSLLLLFSTMTMAIVRQGVVNGIEKWSSRLMPLLVLLIVTLTIYVLTLDGALEGLKVYLLPDTRAILDPGLLLDAMGAAFFSLSLGVGTMLLYGSYLGDDVHLPSIGAQVTLIDVGIAILAGFLILPAMYVAANQGVDIFAADGNLLSEDTLIFSVLPALFDSLGSAGAFLALLFFSVMTIAAVTSSISMLEVPVAYCIERHAWSRARATTWSAVLIGLLSVLIVFNFEQLFGLVITLSTRYGQPILGLSMCIFVGWVWHRGELLRELQKNSEAAASTLFWRIWPTYVRWVCPSVIAVIVIRSIP